MGGACVAAATLQELEDRFPWAIRDPQLERSTRTTVEVGRRIRECLRSRPDASADSLEQELCLLAVMQQPHVPPNAVIAFVDAYIARLRRDHVERLASIRKARVMGDEDQRLLLALANEVARQFVEP